MTATPNLALELLEAAQAQKHVTVNEALSALDALAQASVLDHATTDPPTDASDGDAYLVPSDATGPWSGRENEIAVARAGDWLFHAPRTGWTVWLQSAGAFRLFDGADWILPPAGGALGFPTVGVNAAADPTNRLSVNAPAVLFSRETQDIRLKLDKAAASDVASILFQTDFSSRAEIGLVGDDDLVFKTNPDGAAFQEALRIGAATGHVGIGAAPQTDALTVGGAVQANGFYSGEITIAQDAVGVITPPASGGLFSFMHSDPSYPAIWDGGLFGYDVGASLYLVRLVNYGVYVTTMTEPLTGTTGAPDTLTLSVQAGEIQLENRHPAVRTFRYVFIG